MAPASTPSASTPPGSGPALAPSLSALLWGFQFALLAPMTALLLDQLFAATPGQVGAILAASNLVAFVCALIVPRYVDRTGDYGRPLYASSAAGVLLATVITLAPSLGWAAAGFIALTGPMGVGMALFWGYVRSGGAASERIIRLRAVFSFSWIAGPPFATMMAGAFGVRIIPPLVGGMAVLVMASTWLLLRAGGERTPARSASPETGGEAAPRVPLDVIVAVLVAFTLLQGANNAAVSTMSLFVSKRLGLDVMWAGLTLGAAAGLEIPALLLVGRLSGSLRTTTLVATGCVAGLAYYAAMTLTTGPVLLIGLQVLNAYFFAVLAGVGLTWFQQLIDGAAFAAGLFSNTGQVGAVLAGVLIASVSGGPLGYGGVFAANVVVCLVVLVLILLVGRRLPRHPVEL